MQYIADRVGLTMLGGERLVDQMAGFTLPQPFPSPAPDRIMGAEQVAMYRDLHDDDPARNITLLDETPCAVKYIQKWKRNRPRYREVLYRVISSLKPKRRWYQFSLLTLLVAVTLFTVAFGVFELTRRPVWSIKLPAYHGKSRESVLRALGKPYYRDNLTVEQIKDEFHEGLQAHLDPQITYRAGQTAFIEWRWRDGENNIALWFRDVKGEWIVVDSIQWQHESVQF